MNRTETRRQDDPNLCPAWCTTGGNHRTDHSDTKTFVPATGTGAPGYLSPETGAAFPIVGVGLASCTVWPSPEATVVLWLTGAEHVDQDVYLRPAEARQIATEILDRLTALDGVA